MGLKWMVMMTLRSSGHGIEDLTNVVGEFSFSGCHKRQSHNNPFNQRITGGCLMLSMEGPPLQICGRSGSSAVGGYREPPL